MLFRSVISGLILLAFCCTHITAKAQHYHFYNFNDKEVIPSSFVYKTFEDSKGYLWFLTDRSITRYDGQKTKLFGPMDGYKDGGAYHLAEDKNGVIWIVTVNHKLYYFKNERFNQVTGKTISWLHIDSNDTKWVTTRHHPAIYKLNPDYTYSSRILTTYTSTTLYNLFVLDDSTFLYTLNSGIFLYSNDKTRRMLENETYEGRGVGRIFSINHKIYLTLETGIYEFANNRIYKRYTLTKNEVFDLRPDGNYIWAATLKGLIRFSIKGDQFIEESIYLVNQPVLSVTKTKDKNVWITTRQNGVQVLQDKANHYLKTNSIIKEPLNFLRKDLNNLYLFTITPAYYCLSGNKITSHTLPQSPDGQNTRVIKWVRNISDSQLVAFTNKSLFISNNKYRFWDRENAYVNATLSNYLFMTISKGDLDLLYQGKIIVRGSDYAKMDSAEKMHIIDGPYLAIHDTLYYTTDKGLLKLYYSGNKPIHKLIPVEGLVSKVIEYRNKIYVITQTHGLYILDRGAIINISVADGLAANYCSAIIPYKDHLWIGTSKGVSKINISDLSIYNFTLRDYLVDDQVNDLEIYKDSVYVATNSGLTAFSVYTAAESIVPRIYLEKLLLNNAVDLVRKDLVETDYLNNNFTLQLVSPGYRSGKANKYRLIITNDEGLVDTFNYDNSSIQLLALMPGKYNIRADVMNIDGLWSTKPVLLDIIIHPPFWKTIWFIGLVILVVCSGVAYVLWVSIKRHKEMQEYNRKIIESELKSLRLYMNPHFLFNSLTSLQSFILTIKTDEANYFITKFSKLIRAVMNYSVKGELKLSEEIQLLKNYLELESVRFGTEFSYQVDCQRDIPVEDISIPSLIIQPFVENAIKHGVTGVTGKCYIKVWFEMRGDDLYCMVSDNGKGRQDKAKKETTHISSGIKFTEERIKLLINRNNTPVITMADTEPENKTMPGTTVVILVPILNKEDND